MEYVNFERLEEIKFFVKIFLVFLTIPALSWWWNYIKSFFIEIYEDDEDNNCCPHCHVHSPKPIPPHDLSGGGMAVPPMKIPEKELEYIERDW